MNNKSLAFGEKLLKPVIIMLGKRRRLGTLQTKPEPLAYNLKRFVFHGLNASRVPQFEIESQLKMPQLGEGEILAKVISATICLSDIHTVCGMRQEPTPSVLGHEACVEIVESRRAGAGAGFYVKDRVTFSITDTCGECEFCRSGLSQKCEKLFKYGHASTSNGTGFNGCYATHILIRANTKVVRLPDQIGDALAATINCALSTMVNCLDQIPDRVKRNKNSKILIQGDGMLGLYGCVLLKEIGIERIFCSGSKTVRSEIIERIGAIPISDESIELKSETNKFDCVIEACGSADAIQSGIRLLKPGGVYMLVGMVHPKTELQLTGEQIIRKCLTIKGIHNYSERHLTQAVDFLAQTVNKYPYDMCLSPNVFTLDQLPNAIEHAKKKLYPRVCIRPN